MELRETYLWLVIFRSLFFQKIAQKISQKIIPLGLRQISGHRIANFICTDNDYFKRYIELKMGIKFVLLSPFYFKKGGTFHLALFD